MPFFATIGFFDGVHIGHRALLSQLLAAAHEAEMEPMVVTFNRHPREVLAQQSSEDSNVAVPMLLTTLQERLALLHEAGIAHIKVLDFTPAMARLSAFEFLRNVLRPLGVRGLLMGFNHRFGSDHTTSFAEISTFGAEMGINVKRALPLSGGNDVSSTRIRSAITLAQIDEANALLGHPFMLTGRVEHGKQIGRTIGFPTANIASPPQKLLPAEGVYFGTAHSTPLGKKPRRAIINIGTRPTIEFAGQRTIEAHVIGFSGNLYGQVLTLRFLHFHRPEQTFPTLGALQAQLQADAEECRKNNY